MLFSLAYSSLLLTGAFAATASYTLNLANTQVAPAGTPRTAIVVNRQLSPLIKANKGDQFSIVVNDQLTNNASYKSTSIHWHGFFQRGTAAMDGAAFVTQCPITPGSAFNYRFSTAEQSGTYWYHSHYHTQYCDGLRGPMVVYDPQDPYRNLYDVDNEQTIITLADWYDGNSRDIFHPTDTLPPVVAANLINNRGRSTNTSTVPLSVVPVQRGKRYRLRIINMACDPFYRFSIDGHKLTVIEADGILHRPRTVDSLTIYAGERYSVIVEANQAVGNYWIRASPSSGPQGFQGGMNSAILRYQGAPVREPTGTTQTIGNALVESALVPLQNPGAPGGSAPADVAINIAITLDVSPDAVTFKLNGVAYQSPSVPVLLQILNGNTDAATLLPKGSVYYLPRNANVEISVPGGSIGSPHPFHLHGHAFDVIRSAGQTTRNYVNPPRRDVVNTGTSASDNVTIRFRTDNPGPWFFHCHIDWHLEAGMAVVFAEDPQTVLSSGGGANADWRKLCPAYNALPPSEQ